MVMLGVLFPALFSSDSVPELILLLVVLAVPIILLSGYLLPRWLSQGRAERAVALLRPLFRPWAALLRLVLPTASEATGEYRAFGRESARSLTGFRFMIPRGQKRPASASRCSTARKPGS